MVLLVGEEELTEPPLSPQQLFDQVKGMRDSALKLANKYPKRIEPKGVLYVRQKQWAVTFPGDRLDNGQKVICCGTEDVLTCHVIIIRDPRTGVTAISHFDEFTKKEHFDRMEASFLQTVRSVSAGVWEDWGDEEGGEEGDWEYWDEEEGDDTPPPPLDPDAVYELTVVGGYKDDAGKAEKISKRFFKHLHQLPTRLKILVCCLGEPNTKKQGGLSVPKISGLSVDVNTGLAQSAEFNRTFTDFTEDIRDMLMCYPPLIKTQFRLKKVIARQEDRGYGQPQALCA